MSLSVCLFHCYEEIYFEIVSHFIKGRPIKRVYLECLLICIWIKPYLELFDINMKIDTLTPSPSYHQRVNTNVLMKKDGAAHCSCPQVAIATNFDKNNQR